MTYDTKLDGCRRLASKEPFFAELARRNESTISVSLIEKDAFFYNVPK